MVSYSHLRNQLVALAVEEEKASRDYGTWHLQTGRKEFEEMARDEGKHAGYLRKMIADLDAKKAAEAKEQSFIRRVDRQYLPQGTYKDGDALLLPYSGLVKCGTAAKNVPLFDRRGNNIRTIPGKKTQPRRAGEWVNSDTGETTCPNSNCRRLVDEREVDWVRGRCRFCR